MEHTAWSTICVFQLTGRTHMSVEDDILDKFRVWQHNSALFFGPPTLVSRFVFFVCGKKWWNTQHWSNNGCLQATHTEFEANCFLARIFLIFSDVGRPSVLTPRFCTIFRDEHDSTDRGCNLRAPDRQPRQPHTPGHQSNNCTPTVHDTTIFVVLDKSKNN